MHGIHKGIEEVNGTIIGGEHFSGKIFYDGRIQNQYISGDTEQELIEKAKAWVSKTKEEITKFGLQLKDSCFPDNNKWELRIFD